MGDGLLQALEDIGLGTESRDYLHAHEFGHHVQFELGVFDDYVGSPETTRRTELMADGFGAYFCAHSRGASFQANRFANVMSAAFAIGDCAFDDPGHHGTPNQREKAAQWGANRAASARNQGHVYSSAQLLVLFDEALPWLVAPDAP